jgi:hypothetical protein
MAYSLIASCNERVGFRAFTGSLMFENLKSAFAPGKSRKTNILCIVCEVCEACETCLECEECESCIDAEECTV